MRRRHDLLLLLAFTTPIATGCRSVANFANQTIWTDSERLCERNEAECRRRCPPHSKNVECEVLAVMWVERTDLADEAPKDLAEVRKQVADTCDDDIPRACAALAKIDAAMPKAKEAEASREGAATDREALAARLEAARAELRSIRERPKSVRLEPGLAMRLDRVERSLQLGLLGDPTLPAKLDEADAVLAAVREAETAAETTRSQAAAKRAAAEAAEQKHAEEVAMLTRSNEACLADIPACKKACTSDAASELCLGYSSVLFTGEGLPKNRGAAREQTAKSCEAGLGAACWLPKVFTRIETEEQAKAKAERDLPSLLATCATYRDQIRGMKARGDYDGLKKLEPAWGENLDALHAAIELTTDNQGPRYEQLIREVMRCTGNSGRR